MTTGNPKRSENQLRAILAGIQQVLTAGKTFPYKGVSYDQTALTALVNGFLAPYDSVHSLRTQLETGVANRSASEASTREFIDSFKGAAKGQYGEASDDFKAFGFKPKKKPELTVEQKQHRLDQAKATRAARHTLGRKQKAAIKGVVPPVTGNAANAAPPAPGTTTGQSGSNVAKP